MFQAWKGRPETQGFLRFLAERRADLQARWADGEEMTPHDQSMAQTYGDIIDLNYEADIKPIYVEAGLIAETTEEEESDDVSE